MHSDKPLNIFYGEADPDRWLPFDRFPRKFIRRVYRGIPVPSGQYLVFKNLIKGLDKLNIAYRINNYKYAKKNPHELVCIIGRDQVLFEHDWKNPILFGAAFGINPFANPNILQQYPIKKLLVPGQWVKDFFAPYGEDRVEVWPVGIDTEEWRPAETEKKIDFLVYNKIRWHHDKMNAELVDPIKEALKARNLSFTELRYGQYKPSDLKEKLSLCKHAIFLCEHETQGIAYQQILSSGVSILAWDRGGYWQDPAWYPDKIKFAPVSSVPYWDERCGTKFTSMDDFEINLTEFTAKSAIGAFRPREYVLQNLTLEKCASRYVEIVTSITNPNG
ncbi:MAG TPA: hypothetical protein VG367_17830 [Mucilaginibacter sp.]|jgi:hypothetical protein|nr:hypothetical protein [Mucilaginibacter sp.]